jgi:hypothetical protein
MDESPKKELKDGSRPRIWPGLPTRGSQMVESVFVLFPIWLVMFGSLVAVILSAFRSCNQ